MTASNDSGKHTVMAKRMWEDGLINRKSPYHIGFENHTNENGRNCLQSEKYHTMFIKDEDVDGMVDSDGSYTVKDNLRIAPLWKCVFVHISYLFLTH